MTKCRRCAEGVPHEFNHGRTGYQYHRCRCDVCADAEREYQQRDYEQRLEYKRQYKREYQKRDYVREQQRGYQREYQQRDYVREQRRQYKREHQRGYHETPSGYRARERNAHRDAVADKGRRGPWTDAEVKVLMSNLHLPQREIGCLLGRSRVSVNSKLNRIRNAK